MRGKGDVMGYCTRREREGVPGVRLEGSRDLLSAQVGLRPGGKGERDTAEHQQDGGEMKSDAHSISLTKPESWVEKGEKM